MLPVKRGAAVGDEIEFAEAGRSRLPASGLNGNLVLEECPGFSTAVLLTAQLGLNRLQAAVDGAGG